MASRLTIQKIIADECWNAMEKGEMNWLTVRTMIEERLKTLPEDERMDAENQLRLMVSRVEDQTFDVVRH